MKSKMRTPPPLMDGLRVRTLRGDRLVELPDWQREWVWRSLLKGVRKRETMTLGGLSEQQYVRGVERVRRWYGVRMALYKTQKAQQAAVQVVRPVKPLKKAKRRGGSLVWQRRGMMPQFIFKRTMAEVENAQGEVTYRCMACVQKELPPERVTDLRQWFQVHQGAGMFAQTWHLVVTRQICASCSC